MLQPCNSGGYRPTQNLQPHTDNGYLTCGYRARGLTTTNDESVLSMYRNQRNFSEYAMLAYKAHVDDIVYLCEKF